MSANSSARNNGIDLSTKSPLETVGVAMSKAVDPFGVTTSLLNAQMAWLLHPQELSRAATALSGDLLALQMHVMRRAMGIPSPDVIRPNADDARFADAFEREYVSQGFEGDRAILDTLTIGWKLLSMLPKSELKRIKESFIEQYYGKD